jgi:hypothetical protein
LKPRAQENKAKALPLLPMRSVHWRKKVLSLRKKFRLLSMNPFHRSKKALKSPIAAVSR